MANGKTTKKEIEKMGNNMWISLIGNVLSLVSPGIRDALRFAAIELYRKAQGTKNPWDDIVAGVLLAVLGISTDEAKGA